MRFKQIKKAPDSIMRKKMIVASALALGGVAMLGTTTTVNAESAPTNNTYSLKRYDKSSQELTLNGEDDNFEIPIDLGTDEIITRGHNGTAKYFISNYGVLYLWDGEISVKDTQDIGKKYGSVIKEIDGSLGYLSMPKNSSSMFADNFINVESISFWGVEMSEITNTSLMFANMPSLKRINSSGNGSTYTQSAINMHGMFKNDKKLERMDFDGLVTNSAKDVSEMFAGVSSLKYLGISGFDMTNVINSSKMFEGTKLESVSLGSKNKFTNDDILPSDDGKIWRSVDEGTDENPQGKLTFLPNDTNGNSLSKYYDGQHKIGLHEFVLKDIEKPGVLEIHTNFGYKKIDNMNGKSGSHIKVKVPTIEGYTPMMTEVSVFIRPDGTVVRDDNELVYYSMNNQIVSPSIPNQEKPSKPSNPSGTGNNSSLQTKPQKDKNNTIKANVTISTNLGDIKVQVSGKANEKKTVDVPQRDGYTSDKKTVTVLINANGTATTSESVKYIKNTTEVVRKNTLITTFNDKGNVILYNLDGTKLTRSDRMLASNTDWFSDRQVTIDGILYLRVATNEWIKGSNVYSYQSNIENVKTKRLAMLVNTHGQQVKDRALQTGTSWFTDRIVMINGNKYYRVATNELVSADDIY